MAKSKHKKLHIGVMEYVTASRCGEFEANKEIVGRTKTAVFKNKKKYSRKEKHKSE